MIRLKNVFVYNWGKFDEPTSIPIGEITLLSGANQAGKSQIIDAIMMILTGKKKGIFNKAADKHSARNVEKYLYGYWASNNQEKFLRHDGTFTSYVVLEFYNDVKDIFFCDGLVADCPMDHSKRAERWFSFSGKGIPDNQFVLDDMALNISELKRFLNTYVGEENYHFYSDSEYSKYIMSAYGQVRSEYITLLKAAVSCSIGENLNIASFITDSICSVNESIDLDSIRSTIHDYYDLKDKAHSGNRKIEKLTRISQKYDDYKENIEMAKTLDYAILRDNQTILKDQIEQSQNLISQLEMDIKQTLELNKMREEKQKKFQEKIGLVHEELGKSDTEQIRKSLIDKKKDIDEKIEGYKENVKAVYKTIVERAGAWIIAINKAENAGFVCNEKYKDMLEMCVDIKESDLEKFDIDDVNNLTSSLYNELSAFNASLIHSEKILEEQILDIKESINELSQNKKPYPKETLILRDTLEKELMVKYENEIKIPIFADMLEIKDEEWQNAIEGYLDNQRFDLIVPEEYYDDALFVYRKIKDKIHSYKSGLVDIKSIRNKFKGKIRENSLAEEIISENEDARLYADFKLGNIIKVDDEKDLYKHESAITKDLLVYKGFVVRGKSANQTKYIGKKAAESQLNTLNEKLLDLTSQKEDIASSVSVTKVDKVEKNLADKSFYNTAVRHISDINELEDESIELLKKIGNVDTTRDEELHNELSGLTARLDEITREINSSSVECGRAQNKIESEQRKLSSSMSEMDMLEDELTTSNRFSVEWIREVGDVFISEDSKQNRRGNKKKIREAHMRMKQDAMEAAGKEFAKLKKLRTAYNIEELAGFDTDRSFDNEEYETELRKILDSGISDFEEEIQKAADRATSEFKVEFIGKLKSNIMQAQEQIDSVNEVLTSKWFGNVKYKLTYEKEKAYAKFYDMFMDPNLVKVDPDLPGYGGISIFSGSFEEAHKEELDELLQLIMDDDNLTPMQRITREKKLETYTDYRTYLHLDLCSTDHSGSTKYMSDVIRDESGSGIQTPYYIVMFAAIAQKVRAAEKENTLRVVILDEAFNKMDENKIAASIDLLKSFDLQPIFCCVPEKVKVIAPKADITNIVMMYSDKSSYVENFSDLNALKALAAE